MAHAVGSVITATLQGSGRRPGSISSACTMTYSANAPGPFTPSGVESCGRTVRLVAPARTDSGRRARVLSGGDPLTDRGDRRPHPRPSPTRPNDLVAGRQRYFEKKPPSMDYGGRVPHMPAISERRSRDLCPTPGSVSEPSRTSNAGRGRHRRRLSSGGTLVKPCGRPGRGCRPVACLMMETLPWRPVDGKTSRVSCFSEGAVIPVDDQARSAQQ